MGLLLGIAIFLSFPIAKDPFVLTLAYVNRLEQGDFSSPAGKIEAIGGKSQGGEARFEFPHEGEPLLEGNTKMGSSPG